MEKKKIVWLSNALWLKTGLSRNTKAVLKEFYKNKDKYEIIHYCSGVNELDPNLQRYPWKSIGALPANPQEIQHINSDPHLARMASYGGYRIEKIIKEEKPDIVVCSDDIWAFPPEKFSETPWAKEVNLITHCTIDSLPILPEAFVQAKNSHFYSWANFGEKAIRDEIGDNRKYKLGTIHGAVESEHHQPISQLDKVALRNKFDIPQDAKIFIYVARNQLRKKFDSLLRAFASYKKQYSTNAKLLLHTSWTEGWPLQRIIESLGINNKDILTTHVCSKCKGFVIKPYEGENRPCPLCGEQNSLGSASITNGVTDEEMKYIYGIADAGISLFTSGGQELFNVECLFNGLPLATVKYSCGSDYSHSDIFEIGHVESGECQTGFIKAEPNINDVIKFMKKIDGMQSKSIREMGARSRKWAIETFDSKVIGRQWMEIFDSLPKVDHSKILWDENKELNPSFHPDFNIEGEAFIRHLYSGFLDVKNPDDKGLEHWKQRIENGEAKEQIAQIFQQIAIKDSQKPINIKDLLLENDKKNLFFVIKESLGDCIICLNLLESCRNSYPEHNINIVTEQKYFDVFTGCDYVDNLIPFTPMLENEMAVIGAGQENSLGDVFIMPAIATQKCLNYLSNNKGELIT